MKILFKGPRRGQLQIAETLVSVSLMLVLALLLISATQLVITPESNISYLDQTASDILVSTDEAGILRPVVYLFDNSTFEDDFNYYQEILRDYITSIIPINLDYGLIAHQININDGTINPEYFPLLGSITDLSAIQEGEETAAANYHLGSFSSAEYGLYEDQYLVQLYLWEVI